MKIIVSAKKLPEEHEKEIRSLLQKSFNLIHTPPFDYCFTSVENNEGIGFCAAVERSISVCNSNHQVFLLGLFTIEEKYRKKGIGSALLQYTVSYLENNHKDGVILNCGNERVPFYTANGFNVISEKALYSRNGNIEKDEDPVLLYPYSSCNIEDYATDSIYLGSDF